MKKTAILIAGMHRSGTSALAGSLVKAGINPGYTLLFRTQDNQKGYYENTEVYNLNEFILKEHGYRWDSLDLLEWSIDKDTILQYETTILELLQREFEAEPNILIKDPRLSFLLPIWINALTKSNYRPVIIIQVREVHDIVKSLVRRNKFTTFKASLLLIHHLLASSFNSLKTPIFQTSFEDLLKDKGSYIKRILEDISVEPPIKYAIYKKKIEHFLDKSLTTGSTSGHEVLPSFVLDFHTSFIKHWHDKAVFQEFIVNFRHRLIDLSKSSIIFKTEVEIANLQKTNEELISKLTSEITDKEEELNRLYKVKEEHQEKILKIESDLHGRDINIDFLHRQIDTVLNLKKQWQQECSEISSLVELSTAKTDSLNQNLYSKVKQILDLLSHNSERIIRLKETHDEIHNWILEVQKPSLLPRITKKLKMSWKSYSERFSTIASLILVCIKSPLRSVQNFNFKNLRTLLNALGNEDPRDIKTNLQYLLIGGPRKKYAEKYLSQFAYNFENTVDAARSVEITGWVTHPKGVQKILLNLKDERKFEIKYGLRRTDVLDLYPQYYDSEFSGFDILIRKPIDKNITAFVYSQDGDKIALNIYSEHQITTSNATDSFKNESNSLLAAFEFYRSPNPEYYIDYSSKEVISDGLIKLIAFYLPQFHSIPENDNWWGKNFTEWTNVTQGISRFKGHYQPRLPGDLGFYDLSDLEVLKEQISIAKNYGLYGFCFHYYWFQGKLLLEKPLTNFLNSNIDFNFCICWANENWTRKWDGFDDEILIKQDYTGWDPNHFAKDLIPILKDDRYIQVDGKHLLIIYRPKLIPRIKEVAKSWRREFSKNQIDILLVGVQGFGLEDPSEVGFDLAIEFPPHKLGRELELINGTIEYYDNQFEGYVHDYKELVYRAEQIQAPDNYGLIRTLFPSWDNEARRKGRGTSAYINSTPELYSKWLELCCNYSLRYPLSNEHLVFVNAWNEWAEGAYLEPDRHYGYRYLESTYNVLRDFTVNRSRQKLILVSHDARKHGAQLNALNMCMTIKKQFGFDLVIILLDHGELVPEFKRISETHLLKDLDHDSVQILFNDLNQRGFKKAICNTTVSGQIVADLVSHEIECVILIHELPQLIKDYNLEETVRIISEKTTKQVFAAKVVQRGFNSFLSSPDLSKQIILPQGAYAIDFDHINQYDGTIIRRELKLREEDVLVGGAGFADHRKGIDLFIESAKIAISQRDRIYFVWFGNLESGIASKINKELKDPKLSDRIMILDFRDDIISCLKGLDIFLLTSREDPFPSVVLEALALGVPCITFEENGGICELNRYGNLVQNVPYLDTRALASKLLQLLDDPEALEHYKKVAPRIMKENFSFDDYLFSICQLFDDKLKKISVVVPNYNYGDFIEDRLCSIWKQDYPIFETIVLDDHSSDDSIQQIYAAQKKYNRTIRLFLNDKNSGSVFRQWHKGVNLARGQYIWIAEADDSAKSEFISSMLKLFARCQKESYDLGMVYCQSQQIDFFGNVTAQDYKYYTDDISTTKWQSEYFNLGQDEIRECLSVKNTILNTSSVLWDLEKLRKILNTVFDKLDDFKLAGDWFLYIHMLLEYDIAFCPRSLNIHRRHNTSQTKAITKQRHLDEIELIYSIIDKILGFEKDLGSLRKDYLASVEQHLKKSKA